MSATPMEIPQEDREYLAYASSQEHLLDELKRLDRLINLRILSRKHLPANPLERFAGLVLTQEEISGLLSNQTGPGDDTLAQQSALAASINHLDAVIRCRRSESLDKGIRLSLHDLSNLFGLTEFDERCLIVCLASELDRKYEKLYAFLQGDVTRKKPGVGLILDLLCDTTEEKLAARSVFDLQAPLLKYGLLEMTDDRADEPAPLISRCLKADDRIVSYLLGMEQMDRRLDTVARVCAPSGEYSAASDDPRLPKLLDFAGYYFGAAETAERSLILHLHGPYGSGKRALVETACRELGISLIVGDIRKMIRSESSFEQLAWLLARETALRPAALYLENFDSLPGDDDKSQQYARSLLEAIQTFCRLAFLAGERAWRFTAALLDPMSEDALPAFIGLEFPPLDEQARKLVWETELGRNSHLVDEMSIAELAGKFRFSQGQIRDAVWSARDLARWRSPDDGRIAIEDLHAACRALSSPKLSTLATKINSRYGWDDIVLSTDQQAQLKEMTSQARFRETVFGQWGFGRKLSLGKGLSALFCGPSGTGKTMSAEVIANELQLELYKIDLSQVISKYIGETEKNLDHIFTAAESANAILFFDEADALFGKRSEVRDSHDRYANVEISYLLQKMEQYDGIAILATNLRSNLDEAFTRRLTFAVEFSFPDAASRLKIWERIWPKQTPLSEDLDLAWLASKHKLTGGNIKNVALAAAFLAAAEGGPVRLSHALHALRREYQKMGKIIREADFDINQADRAIED